PAFRFPARARRRAHGNTNLFAGAAGPRGRLGPGPDDQIVRLVETLVREEWINARGMVFRADAAHEPGNDPPLRQIVEHRELFRDVDRIVDQRQGAAEYFIKTISDTSIRRFDLQASA